MLKIKDSPSLFETDTIKSPDIVTETCDTMKSQPSKSLSIRKVMALGPGKDTSSVEFTPGINLLYGHSNTGKSMIFSIINYCLGAKRKELAIDDNLGYDKFTLCISAKDEYAIITRQIAEKKLDIVTNVPGFDDGKYGVLSRNESTKDLNDLILTMIGIKEKVKIIRNSNFKKGALTFRTLLPLCYIPDDRIVTTDSILAGKVRMSNTAFYSALYFIISGKDFQEIEEHEDAAIKKAKYNTLKAFIYEQQKSLGAQEKLLLKKLGSVSDFDIDAEIQALNSQLDQVNSKIDNISKEMQRIVSSFAPIMEDIENCKLLEDRYNALYSQYTSDLKRLTNIVDGEEKLRNSPHNNVCPFCHNQMSVPSHMSYINAAKSETKQLMLQIPELEKTIDAVKFEHFQLKEQLDNKRNDYIRMSETLKTALIPQRQLISENLKKYTEKIEAVENLKWIRSLQTRNQKEIDDIDEKLNTEQDEYKPKDNFKGSFFTEISQTIKEIFDYCNYPGHPIIEFDKSTFDVSISGQTKASKAGQGFRSLINTMIALAFRKYLVKHAIYDIGFLIIDSPLSGLDEAEDKVKAQSMAAKLFEYMAENAQDLGQIIIAGNEKFLPKLDYGSLGINVIEFTKRPGAGRYGFLKDKKD